MQTTVTFGKIHLLSPDKYKKYQEHERAFDRSRARRKPFAVHSQYLSTLTGEKLEMKDQHKWKPVSLPDGRAAVFTDTDTEDQVRFLQLSGDRIKIVLDTQGFMMAAARVPEIKQLAAVQVLAEAERNGSVINRIG